MQTAINLLLFLKLMKDFSEVAQNLTIILRTKMVHFLVQTEKVELERTVVHETKEREAHSYANGRYSG